MDALNTILQIMPAYQIKEILTGYKRQETPIDYLKKVVRGYGNAFLEILGSTFGWTDEFAEAAGVPSDEDVEELNAKLKELRSAYNDWLAADRDNRLNYTISPTGTTVADRQRDTQQKQSRKQKKDKAFNTAIEEQEAKVENAYKKQDSYNKDPLKYMGVLE